MRWLNVITDSMDMRLSKLREANFPDVQGSLACCSPQGRKEWDMTEQLNNNTGMQETILGSERSPGEEKGKPLQYSCLENSMDRGILAGKSPWGHKELNRT